jgi:hypothetical protein
VQLVIHRIHVLDAYESAPGDDLEYEFRLIRNSPSCATMGGCNGPGDRFSREYRVSAATSDVIHTNLVLGGEAGMALYDGGDYPAVLFLGRTCPTCADDLGGIGQGLSGRNYTASVTATDGNGTPTFKIDFELRNLLQPAEPPPPPSQPQTQQPPQPQPEPPSQVPPAQASITTDKGRYRVGERIQICYTVPGSGPIKVIDTLVDGRRQVLRQGTDDGTGDCFTGTVTPPAGVERLRLEVYAANQPAQLVASAETSFTVLETTARR